MDELVDKVNELLKTIHNEMLEKAQKYLSAHTYDVHTMAELEDCLNKGGYSKMMWCGNQACEDAIKDRFNATARCLPFNQMPIGDTCPVCGKKAEKVVLFAKAY